MNNIKLELEFDKIYFISNAFDKQLALKELKKKYKKSDFYKKTKTSFTQAYKMFELHKISKTITTIGRLSDVEYVSALITDYLNGIDSDTLNKVIDKISATFNINKLLDLKGDLANSIISLRS